MQFNYPFSRAQGSVCCALLTFLCCFTLSTTGLAQTERGTITRTGSGAPIPFASVGVKGKALGTVADESGRFPLQFLTQASPSDTIIITCVGYLAQKRLASQLRQTSHVQLTPQPTQLKEVAIRHGKLRPQVLGREAIGGMAHWSNGTAKDSVPRDKRGWEVGTFLTAAANCFVDEFALYVERNNFRFVRFRLLLYEVKDGRPAALLTNQDVQFVVGDQVTGWVKVDLRSFNLHFQKNQKIALALQWLDNDEPLVVGKHFSVPAAFPSPLHRTYVRDKSQAQWQVFPVNPSMHLRVQAYQ